MSLHEFVISILKFRHDAHRSSCVMRVTDWQRTVSLHEYVVSILKYRNDAHRSIRVTFSLGIILFRA